jgi:hypothetical protein
LLADELRVALSLAADFHRARFSLLRTVIASESRTPYQERFPFLAGKYIAEENTYENRKRLLIRSPAFQEMTVQSNQLRARRKSAASDEATRNSLA